MRVSTTVIAAAMVIAAGCGGDCGDGNGPATPIRFASIPDEPADPVPADAAPYEPMIRASDIAAAEAALLERVANYRAMSCPRPLLRGIATPGTAAREHAQLFGEAAKTACDDALNTHSEALSKALRESKRDGWHALSPAVDEPVPAAIADAVTAACRDASTVVQAAVARADACSPRLPGRAAPDSLWRYIRLGNAAAVEARGLAERGQELRAVQRLLDHVRLGHDLIRGGATLQDAMLVAGGHQVVLSELERLLHASLDGDELAAIGRELDILIDTVVHPGSLWLVEADSLALYRALPWWRPASWQPPGGFRDGDPRTQSRSPLTSAQRVRAADGAAQMWLAAARAADTATAACPDTAVLKTCAAKLDVVTRRMEAAAQKLDATDDSQGDGDARRDAALDSSAADILTMGRRFSHTVMWSTATLAAVRVAVTARRRGCDRALRAARKGTSVRVIGGELAWTRDGDTITARLPVWLAPSRDVAQRSRLVTVRCAK